MTIHSFSATKNMFFVNSLRETYKRAGNWPEDTVEIADDIATQFMRFPPTNQMRGVTSSGGPCWIEKLPPTRENIESNLKVVVQTYLDKTASNLGYYDIVNAISYADEPSVAKFELEGKALRKWRSLVWSRFYELFSDEENVLKMSNQTWLIKMLPVFVAQ